MSTGKIYIEKRDFHFVRRSGVMKIGMGSRLVIVTYHVRNRQIENSNAGFNKLTVIGIVGVGAHIHTVCTFFLEKQPRSSNDA